jgi:hypothetical protein
MDGWLALHTDRTWKSSVRWLASLVLLVAVLSSGQQSQAQSTDESSSRTSGITDQQVSAQSTTEQYTQLTARIAELEREIDALRVAGRPKYFHRRRALGRAALILGALAVTSGAMIGIYAASVSSGDSEPGASNELSPGAKALIGVPIGAGLVLIGGGTWTLISLRKGNANQARIDARRETQRSLKRERNVN